MIILTREQVINFVKEYKKFYEDFKDKFDLGFHSEKPKECFIKLYTSKEEFLNLDSEEEKALNYDVHDIFNFNLYLNHSNIDKLNKDLDHLELMDKCIIKAYDVHMLKRYNRLGSYNSYLEFQVYCSTLIKQAIKDGRLE